MAFDRRPDLDAGTDPGNSPDITEMIVGPGGLVAVGYIGGYPDDWHAAVWSSPDGVVWTERAAPLVSELDGVAASDDVIVATGTGYDLRTGSAACGLGAREREPGSMRRA